MAIPKISPLLEELRGQEKYGAQHSYAPFSSWWLLWNPKIEPDDNLTRLFEWVFDPPRRPNEHEIEWSEPFFFHRAGLDSGRTIPRFRFREHWYTEAFEEEYDRAVAYYTEGSATRIVLPDKLQELIAIRDALEKQITREAARLTDAFEGAKSVMKVWLAESAKGNTYFQLAKPTRYFWTQLQRGVNLKEGSPEPIIDYYMNRTNIPKELVESQKTGIFYYAHCRDEILKPTLRLDDKRMVLEFVLYNALLEEPLLNEEEVASYLNQDQEKWERDGRSRAKHLEPKLVACYHALRDSEESEGLGNPKVREKVLGSYDVSITDRQFQNYLSENDKPTLSKSEIKNYLKHLKHFWGTKLRA